MENLTTYQVLLAICSLVVLSYFFSVINRLTRIPSVLLLLGTGMLLRLLVQYFYHDFHLPNEIVEILGTVGLIMIVLEAGLDLHVNKQHLPLIKRSFYSALVIFLLSAGVIASLLKWWLSEADWMKCLVYAIPLSIISSAIVLPSVHHLSKVKKEFLIYEASFSDVLGIMVFNFLTTDITINLNSVVWFGGSFLLSILFSVVVCLVLMLVLLKNRVHIKFFLVFAVLIIVYTGGKMLHIPSLITILTFGIVVNNWESIKWSFLHRHFPVDHVDEMARFLKSITAESSFLIRTFFFVIFGFQIDLHFFYNTDVWILGSLIVLALLILRYVYLRVLHKYYLLPELFYIPRGLITVLLFYKIPVWQKIQNFDEGILFFVILATGLILMVGSIFFHDKPIEMDTLGENNE